MDQNTPPQEPAPVSPPPTTHPSGIPEPERQWGMFAHLSSLLAFIGIPFANVIGPFIMAAVKANEGIAYRYPLCIRMVK